VPVVTWNVGGCNIDNVELLIGHVKEQIEFKDFVLCVQEVLFWPSTEEWAEKHDSAMES